MSQASTVNFSETDQGLFTPDEIRRLMRVEFDRAVRYGYPAAAMLIEVDRLEYLHDLYGWESREEVLGAVIQLLRSTTRDSDFLACMQGHRILSLFPHADQETIGAIAGRMLRVCRELDFRINARSIRATLSIGVSVLKPGAELEFGEFLRSAHEAASFALQAGGDRFVQREPASEVISDLRGDIDEEARLLTAPPDEQDLEPTEQDLELTARVEGELRALLTKQAGKPYEQIVTEALARAVEGMREAREMAVGQTVRDHQGRVNLLERRLNKLRDALDKTEQELGRALASHGGESGVASIYRSVQGLQGDEQRFETKKEMLTLIFEANLQLQRKKSGEP